MRRYALAAIAAVALAGPAISADFGTSFDDGPTAPAAAWDWTGCYVGGQIGGLWGRSDKWIVRTPGGDFFGESVGGHSVDGVLGGVQVGCDYQMGGILFGIQGDYGWSDARGTHASTKEFGVFYHSKVGDLASVTGRIGHPWGRFLGYVKGGIAIGEVSYSASTILIGTAYRASDTRVGWTVGAGGEYAVNRSLSVFLEYDYYDFGTSKIRLTPQIDGLNPAFVDIEEAGSVVRAGINVRF